MITTRWKFLCPAVDATIARTRGFLSSRVTDSGFEGVGDSLLAHYKASFCLSKVGEAADAARILRHVRTRFFVEAGHYDRDLAPGRGWVGGSYSDAWVAAGAFNLGLNDIAQEALSDLEARIDRRIGSLANMPRMGVAQRWYDTGTASRAIETFLNAGRVEPAVRLGLFVKSVFDAQPEGAEVVSWVRNAEGQLVFEAEQARRQPSMMNTIGLHGQCYWFFGFALRNFARLYRIDRWQGWLDSAERIHGWLARSHPDATANITNAKLGWGSAEMFEVTGDERWAATALAVAEWLVANQQPEGIWVRPEHTAAGQPLDVSLDTATERMYYLHEMRRAFALRA